MRAKSGYGLLQTCRVDDLRSGELVTLKSGAFPKKSF